MFIYFTNVIIVAAFFNFPIISNEFFIYGNFNTLAVSLLGVIYECEYVLSDLKLLSKQ